MEKKHLVLGLGGIGGVIGGAVALKLLSREKTANWDDYADEIHHPENSNFVEVDGVTIHYQEFGNATNPKMVLIHGYTASTYVWHTVAPQLADAGFHVISVDLVGFGYSDKPSWFDYSIASQARIILRFINCLGIGKATFVGSSYGGAVTSWFTLDNPERVEKLVLVGAVCNNEPKFSPIFRVVGMRGIGETVSPFLIDSKRFLRHRMKGTLDKTNHHLITEDRVESILRPLKAADAHYSLLMTARNWEADRIEEDAHLIEQPTLLIWGERDNVIPLKNGEKLYDRILNSRLVILKNCGHVPPEEKPELFVDLVTEFCKDKRGHLENKEREEMTLEQIEIMKSAKMY
ncbi:MAG: alpha/beta fold hydrolase [Aridibacter sp.]